jgi:hypothetical protein
MRYLGVPEHKLHPAPGELLLLLTQGGGEALQRAAGDLAHARDPLTVARAIGAWNIADAGRSS